MQWPSSYLRVCPDAPSVRTGKTGRTRHHLTLVNLIHQSLRADAQRLPAAVTALDPSDRPGRLPRIRAFFDQYRAQLATHHDHEDELFFPALQARVGADEMHLNALAGQHEALDAALHVACDALAALTDPAGDFTADRARAADALSVMAELLAAHLTRGGRNRAAPYRIGNARRGIQQTRGQGAQGNPPAAGTVHDPMDHRPLHRRSAESPVQVGSPTRLLYWLNRRRYRHLDQALTYTPSQPTAASPSRPA